MVNEVLNKKSDLKQSSKLKKEKVQTPLTKIVVRKLPPTFTEEEFRNAISPIPENNYFAFVAADRRLGSHAYSRVYINFLNPDEVYSFRDRFDGYVFVDQKGSEYPALVEYASFQKIPKSSHMKKDIRCGTIDEDADFVAFLDLLQNPEIVSLPPIETLLEEIENMERELRANHGVLKIKTPLLEYVEQRYKSGDKKRKKEFDRRKARDEERRRRRDVMKEYRKRDDHYSREERDRERAKRREEEKIKWKERREERERQIKEKRAERAERYKSSKTDDRSFSKTKGVAPPQEEADSTEKPPRGASSQPPATQKTKRYSEVRRKEEREKKKREDEGEVENRESDRVKGEKRENDGDKRENDGDKRGNDGDKRGNDGEKRGNDGEKRGNDGVNRENGGKKDKNEDLNSEEREIERDTDKKEERHKERSNNERKDIEDDTDKKEDIHKDNDRITDKKEDKFAREEREERDRENRSAEREEEDKPEAKEVERRSEDRDREKKAERRIRNKDRPAMQLYRPGQSRLKARPAKSNEEGSGDLRANDGSSSSSSASPIMGTSEKEVIGSSEKKVIGASEKPTREEKESSTSKPVTRGGYGKKSYTGTSNTGNKYRDSRKGTGNYYYERDKDSYWEDKHYKKYKNDYYEGNRDYTGNRDYSSTSGAKGRKGYSYYQERENKKHATSKGTSLDRETSGRTSKETDITGLKETSSTSSKEPNTGSSDSKDNSSQVKSLSFTRSTSQE